MKSELSKVPDIYLRIQFNTVSTQVSLVEISHFSTTRKRGIFMPPTHHDQSQKPEAGFSLGLPAAVGSMGNSADCCDTYHPSVAMVDWRLVLGVVVGTGVWIVSIRSLYNWFA